LSATHRGREVVRGVGFAAHAGEVIAITGLNGAGKSTLSRLMCGLHRPGRGILRWEGRMLARGDRLRLSAMVFQDVNYQLFADSVAAEVGFGLGTTDSGVVAGLLEELDLGELAERHPATLSGGQKQRLAVAASIAAGKRILVFDEPTSGLDLIGMTRVADLVRRVAANGSVVFVATHDLEFICRSCTRVLHLADGGITDDVPLGPDDVPRIAGLLGGRVSGWSAADTERCGVSGPDRTALT